MLKRNLFFVVSFFCLCFVFLLSIVNIVNAKDEPWAIGEWRLHLSQKAVDQGYTVVVDTDRFKLGVRDNAVNQPVTVVIRELTEYWAPDGPVVDAYGNQKDYKRVSSAWEFDLLGDPRVGVLNKPLYVAIKNPERKDEFGNKIMNRKQIHFWDSNAKVWHPLPGTNDLEENLSRALIHLPYSILAIFEIPNEYEAWASWYGDSLTPSSLYNCASNKYEIGSYVKVCRSDNRYKCVKVRVVSTGPFVDNRIVDLTKTAFSVIGNPGGGVLAVRVSSY
ncbi:septal ring lytic transglycosylase RlpA family protein [Patescibacteria group bacterium]|nr:septal ring lytic transglycosylase RlpA family protein [Patescibacteria group bacterium]